MPRPAPSARICAAVIAILITKNMFLRTSYYPVPREVGHSSVQYISRWASCSVGLSPMKSCGNSPGFEISLGGQTTNAGYTSIQSRGTVRAAPHSREKPRSSSLSTQEIEALKHLQILRKECEALSTHNQLDMADEVNVGGQMRENAVAPVGAVTGKDDLVVGVPLSHQLNELEGQLRSSAMIGIGLRGFAWSLLPLSESLTIA